MNATKRFFFVVSLVLIGVLTVGPKAHSGMLQGFQMSGNLGYELTGLASPGGPVVPVNGSITLNNIPPGATIQQAFLYANDFASGTGTGGGSLDFAFSQAPASPLPLGSTTPTSSDPNPISLAYGYEIGLVPTSIIGNGTYNVQISQTNSALGNANQLAGAGLLVIYSFPLLPVSTITVNHGVFMMGANGLPSSASTTFTENAATIPAGSGKLSILTFADDPANSGETVVFNGTNIGGPLDANLPGGGSASVLNFNNVTTLGSGNDQVTVTSTGDVFGWHVAVLQSQVPEPSTLLLVAMATLGLLMRRRS